MAPKAKPAVEMPSLPTEILLLILKALAAEEGASACMSQRRLFGPLLVNRAWAAATLAFLYQTLPIRLEIFNVAGLSATNGMVRSLLMRDDAYASLVRKITVNVVWPAFDQEEEDEDEDTIALARTTLDAEVEQFETLLAHLARNQTRFVTVRLEMLIGCSKDRAVAKDEEPRKQRALSRVSAAIRQLVEGTAAQTEPPTRGKLEIVFNTWSPQFATDVPDSVLQLAPFVTDIGCHELCSPHGQHFRSMPSLTNGGRIKRITLCSCWQLNMLSSLPQLIHLCVTRCYETAADRTLDKLGESLEHLSSTLKSLEVALPNSDTHIRQLLRSLSPLAKLERLHMNLYRPFEAVAPPSPDRMPIPGLPTIKDMCCWAHEVETRRSKARRADAKPELPSVLVDMLSAPRTMIRSIDLSWTDVTTGQLEGILSAVGKSVETLVVNGCKQLGSVERPLASLSGLVEKYCEPRVLTEIWADDLGDCDDVLEELRCDEGAAALAKTVGKFPRISVFAVLGPSNSDLEMFAALKRGGDKGAGLLDLTKWEEAQASSPLEEDDEVGVFGDGSVKLDLRKLRSMAR
jgi:hypothetical protein